MSVNMRHPVVAGILTCQPRNPHAAILGPMERLSDILYIYLACGKSWSSYGCANQKDTEDAVRVRYEKRLDGPS